MISALQALWTGLRRSGQLSRRRQRPFGFPAECVQALSGRRPRMHPLGYRRSFSACPKFCQACTQGLTHSVCRSPRWRHRAPAGENDWRPSPKHRLFAVAQLGCAGWFSALHNWRWCWTTFFLYSESRKAGEESLLVPICFPAALVHCPVPITPESLSSSDNFWL